MKTFFSLLSIAAMAGLNGDPLQPSNRVDVGKSHYAASEMRAEILQALKQLKNYANTQTQIPIQNSDLAYAFKKALVIADLLINSDGSLNLAIRPSIKLAFKLYNPKEFEANMGKFLDHMDPSWQPFFDTVSAPQDPNGAGSLALRALFGLAPDQPLTDRHAKVAVLSALLAPENQGPVGDCFAVSAVIRDHDEYYRHSADDYRTLVASGMVQRPVNGTVDSFFFLPVLADADRNQTFQISASGAFPNTSLALFDAPGFAAARSIMGGNGLSNLSEAIMNSLSNNGQQDPVQTTPSKVIAAMARAIASQTNGKAETLISPLNSLGEYAFSSLTNHPVLRGEEAAFAAMAEDRPNDSTRGNINSCVDQALQSAWESLGDQASPFKQAFETAFNASYRLVYNLNIPLAHVSADGSSTDGGFQLYSRIPENPASMGSRDATPNDFRNLVLNAITAAEMQLHSIEGHSAGEAIRKVVHTNEFLKEAFWAYDPANKSEPHPLFHFLRLPRTPMQSCDGDNPYEVDDIDTGGDNENSVQTHTSKNAKDLLTWCLHLAKKAPAELLPMNSPQHAFNFVPGNPDIQSYIKLGLPTSKWIQYRLAVPGIKVSRSPIAASVQKAFADGMYNQISNALQDPGPYQSLVQKLDQQSLSVKDYATQLLNGINQLLGSDASQSEQVALALDAVLLQSLGANGQAILGHSAVRFAFTNWNEGTDDIYFCAFFNPRTEKIGFGTIMEDKTGLQPMDENAWVNNQQWDVDLNPVAPSNTLN